MRQISQVSVLLVPAPAAAPYANMVHTKRGHVACFLPTLCARLSGFRGTPHQIIPKAMKASTSDACQLTKCCTAGSRSVVFFAQERNIHLDRAALTEEARVCMSCSSAWKLSPGTQATTCSYILVWNQRLKAAGQLKKHLSPILLNGHLKRWPTTGEADGLATSQNKPFACALGWRWGFTWFPQLSVCSPCGQTAKQFWGI